MVLVTDSSFGVIEYLAALCRYNVTCITCLRLDAALYTPAPPRSPRRQGAATQDRDAFGKSVRGVERHQNGLAAPHNPVGMAKGERRIELASAVWRHSGRPVVPIRLGAGARPLGRFEPQALLCTTLEYGPEQVLR